MHQAISPLTWPRPFRGAGSLPSPFGYSSYFLIYVTVLEFSHLFGPGELPRLFFTSRPSELQLNRRQRMRELLRLSRLMDAHPLGEFRDPTDPLRQEVIDIVQGLARKARQS
jgi:hypothetical protein